MEELKEIIKRNKKEFAKWAIVGFIGIPFVSYLLSEVRILPVCGSNDWAGFWGSYLGAILGGGITLYVMKKSLDQEDIHKQEEEKTKYFENIIRLVSELIGKSNLYASELQHYVYKDAYAKRIPFDSKEFAKMLSDIEIKLCELEIMLKAYRKCYKDIDILLAEVEKIRKDILDSRKNIDVYDTRNSEKVELIDYRAEAVDLKAQDIHEHIKNLQKILLNVVEANL